MDRRFNAHFVDRWRQYFGQAELPIALYYTDQPRPEDCSDSVVGHRCLIGSLNRVRDGHPFVFNAKTPGCQGGKRYSGFSQKLRANFEYFLSCGIEGELEGERYKKSPELVREYLAQHQPFAAPGQALVFKRWDRLDGDEQPQVVIFYATPDVLAGLFTLANYDVADVNGVIAPMGAGCSSIVQQPLQQATAAQPKCVLGMFDVSARPHIPAGMLTFALPFARFEQLVANMDESFLTTGSWREVQSRLAR